jgi:hypothetical protein
MVAEECRRQTAAPTTHRCVVEHPRFVRSRCEKKKLCTTVYNWVGLLSICYRMLLPAMCDAYVCYRNIVLPTYYRRPSVESCAETFLSISFQLFQPIDK